MTPIVLFVDDEENILRSFRRVLQPYGKSYDFRFASGAEEALRLSHDAPPAFLFTDSKMPTVSGRELILHMKKLFPGLVAILISGEIHRDESEAEVADHFLAKPCGVGQIMKILEEHPT